MDPYSSRHQDLDSVMGTMSRIPRLTSADGFSEWKHRIENHIKLTNQKIWRSILRDPVQIYDTDDVTGVVFKKLTKDYTDADFDKVELDEKAMAILTMALTPEIAQGFREYTNAKSLWEALVAVYEGNEDMKQSRQDLLRQSFNMFNHILGETLEAQLQRFSTLTTEISSAGIVMPRSEINKKLLNSLHEKWDMNVFVIKKTSNLNTMTLADTMAVIKSFDMDVTQRELNRASYNVGSSSNSAFSAQPSIIAPSPSCAPVAKSQVYSAGTSSNVPTIHTGPMAKGVEENMAMMTGLISC